MSEELPPPDHAAVFATTRWTVVLAARQGDEQRQAALEELCRAYWLPVYGYIRRRGHTAEDAEDLTQGFFAEILRTDFLERPDPAKGRFRGYLIGALQRHLSHATERAQAVKRGGRVQFLEWDEARAEELYARYELPRFDPSQAYETSWALTLLARGLERLEQEQAAAGDARIFAVLRPYLGTAPGPGDYDAAAAELGTHRRQIALLVHRLAHRYGELVRLEVAATVEDPGEVAEEMAYLQRVLER